MNRKQMIEKAAKAMAILDDYDGCFERLAGTDPEEPLSTDEEDAEFWRKRADAALTVFEEVRTTGPAFIDIMPPSPETSKRWWSMYCRECGIEEGMADSADDERLIARRDEHNRQVHTPTDDERGVLANLILSMGLAADADDDRYVAEQTADRIIAAGFHRTVQDEPSDSLTGPMGPKTMQAFRGGEPSDAAVRAAAIAIFEGYVSHEGGRFDWTAYSYDREKAEYVAGRALRAAAETERGEHRE